MKYKLEILMLVLTIGVLYLGFNDYSLELKLGVSLCYGILAVLYFIFDGYPRHRKRLDESVTEDERTYHKGMMGVLMIRIGGITMVIFLLLWMLFKGVR